MPNEDCLNVRLGDYFHERRSAVSDTQRSDAEPEDRTASEAPVEQGAE